ncbi:fructosamine kinase family protein [Sideroxydans lithotrophicus]|uniref:Fructosamine/Ketosamine-3-kinase n=1 Tax=Sideroxydans lithotrophicus (strain ES-1) TaxID=580332 RepID=D5CPU8_SIDLE|nr:fructosamine kinase family protein [Sideroxydans lithotrophicus]ADE13093.1 Fructosamine/Ketosamine-3-kinase [Sideroxydans lithotrophicus ES-1]
MKQQLSSQLSAAVQAATQRPFAVSNATPVGGGDINAAFSLQGTDGSRYFLKLNDAQHHAMFAAEAAGLDAIAATDTIRVPRPVAHGIAGEQSFLVLEHLELRSRGNAGLLGQQLAALHRCTATRFGFAQDNFIGTTPQPNAWKDDWMVFWRERRLGFQLQIARENGYGGQLQTLGAELLDALPAFFKGYAPQPSLLHGDLWGGNHAFTADGTPTIFDPAVYYGDRECDIAMTELFGGYPADFHAAYSAAWPLDAGYARRRDLYNLYHILNHANLFGGGYARQAEQMVKRLLLLIEAG